MFVINHYFRQLFRSTRGFIRMVIVIFLMCTWMIYYQIAFTNPKDHHQERTLLGIDTRPKSIMDNEEAKFEQRLGINDDIISDLKNNENRIHEDSRIFVNDPHGTTTTKSPDTLNIRQLQSPDLPVFKEVNLYNSYDFGEKTEENEMDLTFDIPPDDLKQGPANYRERKPLQHLPGYVAKYTERPPDRSYMVNVSLSDSLPLNRDILDTRPRACLNITYDYSSYHTASVIVPFYNEALSLLLRTVHSILERTPPQLLKEILLVDDMSSNQDLGIPLEMYLRNFNHRKVRLVRNQLRQGLIRSRQIGADLAQGWILVFQDAHTENNVGWLEPIMQEIFHDRSVVVQPIVDPIDKETLNYGNAPLDGMIKTAFRWDLQLAWMARDVDPFQHHTSPMETESFNVPVLVGCVFAVEKRFFLDLGGFDTDMDLWGGENIEVAFRTWMCGGKVITQPCSRVGHLYRPLPYLSENHGEIDRNLARIAEIWMDQYKHFYHASRTRAVKLKPEDHASIARRRQARNNMKCKSFLWFMENVVPEIPTPTSDSSLYGHITNQQLEEGCLGLDGEGSLKMFDFCNKHTLIPYLLFSLNKKRQLYHVYREQCIYVDPETSVPFVGECSPHSSAGQWLVKFPFKDRSKTLGQLIFMKKNYKVCLTAVIPRSRQSRSVLLQMQPCMSFLHPSQLWTWSYRFSSLHDVDPIIYRASS